MSKWPWNGGIRMRQTRSRHDTKSTLSFSLSPPFFSYSLPLFITRNKTLHIYRAFPFIFSTHDERKDKKKKEQEEKNNRKKVQVIFVRREAAVVKQLLENARNETRDCSWDWKKKRKILLSNERGMLVLAGSKGGSGCWEWDFALEIGETNTKELQHYFGRKVVVVEVGRGCF